MNKITEHEAQQMRNANATGRQPVVFVHGLWLLPSSWDRWAALFEEAGYTYRDLRWSPLYPFGWATMNRLAQILTASEFTLRFQAPALPRRAHKTAAHAIDSVL